ncbi:hypothetical protein [Nocardia rhizosphaerae]|uniref:PPE family protein n=1 Tax=Nocardia rhizosphaerae TaxID=1691571 RepID=A0ABV8KZZ1_9NOCA
MALPLIAAIAAVAAVAEADRIYGNYSTAHDEAKARGELGDAANDAVSEDRSIIQGERSRLESGFDGTYASPVLTGKLDDFSTLSHQQIWDALNGTGDQPGVSAGEINAGADGWRRLVTGMSEAVTTFRTRIDTAINDGWSGTTANAAIDGVRGYATEAEKLPTTFQMVANGIDLMEGALLQAKMAIDEPKELSWDGKLTSWVPGGGLLKTESYRADEAERAAQEILERVYKPQAATTDEKTPVLAVPKNPVVEGQPVDDGTGGAGTNNGNGGNNGTTPNGDQGTPRTTTPQTTTPETTSPSTENPGDDTGDDSDDDTTTSSTTPEDQQTTPAGTQQNPGTTTPGTTPGGTTPGTGGPGSTGSPGTTSPGSGTPLSPTTGRAVPGTPATGTPAAAAAAGRGGSTGGRGMMGAPGMMGGGGRGAGNNDDDEHKTPDYLIQDRESELIGQLPPTLPPGGVIGA